MPKGFRGPFTRTAVESAKSQMRSFTSEYHTDYGGPDIDVKEPTVRIVFLSDDGLAVEREVEIPSRLPRASTHRHWSALHMLAPEIAHYTLNKISTAP